MSAEFPYSAFVSYSSKDGEFVTRMVRALEERHIKVWRDVESIEPGQLLGARLQKGLRQSRDLLAVISPDYVRSVWTEEELCAAIVGSVESRVGANGSSERRVIPVYWRDAEVPEFLKSRRHIDFRDGADFEIGIRELVQVLSRGNGGIEGLDAEVSRANEQIRKYLEFVRAQSEVTGIWRMARTLGLKEGVDKDQIKTLYVPARLQCRKGSSWEVESEGSADGELTLQKFLSSSKSGLSVLLGNPGSGKTTATRYLGYRLSTYHLGVDFEIKGADSVNSHWDVGAEDWSVDLRACLPIRVEIKRWAQADSSEELRSYLAELFQAKPSKYSEADANALADQLLARSSLIILDGLDEAPSQRDRENALQLACSLARSGQRVLLTCRDRPWKEESWNNGTVGWETWLVEQGLLSRDEIRVARLLDFDDSQALDFSSRWFGDDRRAASFLEGLGRSDSCGSELGIHTAREYRNAATVRPLIHSPLLLAMALLQSRAPGEDSDKSQSRLELYERLCSLLLAERETDKLDEVKQKLSSEVSSSVGIQDPHGVSLEQVLRELPEYKHFPPSAVRDLMRLAQPRLLRAVSEAAFQSLIESHEVNNENAEAEGSADVSKTALIWALIREFPWDVEEVNRQLWAQRVLKTIQFRERLVVDRMGNTPPSDGRRFTFPHRTFLEYLAGRYLADCPDYVGEMGRAWARISEDSVRAAVITACELRMKRWTLPEDSEASEEIPYWVWRTLDFCDPKGSARKRQEIRRWRAATELGVGVRERLASDILVACGLGSNQRFRDWFLGKPSKLDGSLFDAMVKPTVDARLRADIGRNIGWMGDPRPGVGVSNSKLALPVFDWVRVKNESREAFWVSKYPVTISQFLVFANSGESGYNKREFWSAGGYDKREPDPGTRLLRRGLEFAAPNQPMVYVSWHDCVAFCKWLTALYRSNPGSLGEVERNASDLEIRLPFEAEWALYTMESDYEFPWGSDNDDDEASERMNCQESGIGSPCPVGQFPNGASVASGNSEGGILDLGGNVWEWMSDAQGSFRVLRGGSWSYGAELCRSSIRRWGVPGRRNVFIGFRVVLAPAL